MILGGAPAEKQLNAFMRSLIVGLLAWSGLSIVAGVLLLAFVQVPFWGGFALQCFLWAVIDIAIAGWGWWREQHALPPLTADGIRQKAGQLRRNLLWNGTLDMLYILLGILILTLWAVHSIIGQGHGTGMIVQGSFLLFFDVIQAYRLGRLIPGR
jgi:hypothetical protein